MHYKTAKGTFDILPQDPDPQGKWRESHLWQYLEKQIRDISSEYGFQEIRTPFFETTELFTRSIGSTTDIVTKEMYTFHDKANRSLTLRPEGTAPVMRAFIEKNLDQLAPLHKFFYLFPMFRYERQQAGRYRQHHQFGVEIIGSDSPYHDVEVIHLLWLLYERLGLKGLTLHLNSIGRLEDRKTFQHELKKYLHPHLNELSSESQARYSVNILRILDSKNEKDQRLLREAPSILDYISDNSKAHFESVCSLLEKAKIPYQINPNLVRGLDYYNNTVFEITSDELGAQNSLGGGGRYDDLIQQLGGPNLPSIGFGAGLERIIQTMIAQKVPLPSPPHVLLFFVPIGEAAKKRCFELLCQLRHHHISAEMEMNDRKLKNALRYADKRGAHFTLVVGEEELASGEAHLKEMATGASETLALDALLTRLTYELQKNT
ncbi:MAG: histidine--tRNA ligase [Chlamydiales bacterium]